MSFLENSGTKVVQGDGKLVGEGNVRGLVRYGIWKILVCGVTQRWGKGRERKEWEAHVDGTVASPGSLLNIRFRGSTL